MAETVEEEIHLVLFEVGEELWGVRVEQVREIVTRPRITRVPNTPPFVQGITNLRGQVIAVVDPRIRFGLKSEGAPAEYVVVTEMRGAPIGLAVDSVEDVVRQPISEIVPAFTRVQGGHERYVSGITHVHGRMVVALDFELAFSDDELEAARLIEGIG